MIANVATSQNRKIGKIGKKIKIKIKTTAKDNRTSFTKSTPIVNYAFRTWQPNLL
jgi:hypothetical protein